MEEIILLEEKDNVINCLNEICEEDLKLAISRYRYFYNKTLIVNGKLIEFNGIDVDEENDIEKEYKIKLYSRLVIKPIQMRKKKKIKEPVMTASMFLEYFEKLYEDNYGIILTHQKSTKQMYIQKLERVMDTFYKNGFDQNTIKKYIKRCVMFGNHKGDAIYLGWIYDENTVNNYLLILKGIKSVSDLWRHLDVSISNIEKRKIKYFMNIGNFETFSEIEKQICMKLYKIYDKLVFEELKSKHKYENGFYAKVKIFELLSEEEQLNMSELLLKTKHTDKYFQYEYIKEQLADVLNKKEVR